MKPNINFLRKVEARQVRHVKGYAPKRGGYWKWYGGEQTARQHAQAGFVEMPTLGPELGRPVYVTLTALGKEKLCAAS